VAIPEIYYTRDHAGIIVVNFSLETVQWTIYIILNCILNVAIFYIFALVTKKSLMEYRVDK